MHSSEGGREPQGSPPTRYQTEENRGLARQKLSEVATSAQSGGAEMRSGGRFVALVEELEKETECREHAGKENWASSE